MGIAKYNSEGYPDPTAYEAVRNAEAERKKWRPLVYVCSPYAGDTDGNEKRARRYCRFAVDQGSIPVAPHLLFPQFMSEETERELALFMGNVLLGRCEQIWVFGTEYSPGMTAEITRAKRRNMTVRYFTTECIEICEEDKK